MEELAISFTAWAKIKTLKNEISNHANALKPEWPNIIRTHAQRIPFALDGISAGHCRIAVCADSDAAGHPWTGSHRS